MTTTWSLTSALTKNTTDPVAAKLAEWARDHHLGPVVSFLEQKQLDLQTVRTGGRVAGGFTAAGAQPPTNGSATGLPAPLRPFDSGQPGEGQWQVLLTVNGAPALLDAGLVPDSSHTSYVASVARFDPRLVRFQLRPGALDPGGTWSQPSTLKGAGPGLLAAFNSGFRLRDSQGGMVLDGRPARPMVDGAATAVVHTDGTLTIGTWGTDTGPSADVVAARQNLRLLIENGAIAPTVDNGGNATWGRTLDGTSATWRSGLGTTADGTVVYVDGPAMSTRTLAAVLQRAGATQAMELDINPQWTHLDWYTRDGGATVGHRLNAAQQTGPDHYLLSAASSRDFFAVYSR